MCVNSNKKKNACRQRKKEAEGVKIAEEPWIEDGVKERFEKEEETDCDDEEAKEEVHELQTNTGGEKEHEWSEGVKKWSKGIRKSLVVARETAQRRQKITDVFQ